MNGLGIGRGVLVGCVAWVIAVSFASGMDADIRAGDSVHHVHEVLGRPKGYLKTYRAEYQVFDRGTVALRAGRVVEADLVSEEEATVRRKQREQRRREREAAARDRRRLQTAEGLRIRLERHADPMFLAADPMQRLSFWRSFRKRYPGVDVREEYAQALSEWRREESSRRLQAEVLALERRVAEAESRARSAEEAAERYRRIGVSRYGVSQAAFCAGPRRPGGGAFRSVGSRRYSGILMEGPAWLLWQRDYFDAGSSRSLGFDHSGSRWSVLY